MVNITVISVTVKKFLNELVSQQTGVHLVDLGSNPPGSRLVFFNPDQITCDQIAKILQKVILILISFFFMHLLQQAQGNCSFFSVGRCKIAYTAIFGNTKTF